MKYNCSLTADSVIFSGDGVVLIRRKNAPFQGQLALPGGFVEENETLEQACVREAKEETNLELKNLRFVGLYSNPDRDPRGRVVTGAFIAKADLTDLQAGDDASGVEIVKDWQNVELAFDHKQILLDAWQLREGIQ